MKIHEAKLNPLPNPLPARITKGELAKIRIPEGVEYDCALPQGWLDHYAGGNQDLYDKTVCRCVTVYFDSICPTIVNLITGEMM